MGIRVRCSPGGSDILPSETHCIIGSPTPLLQRSEQTPWVSEGELTHLLYPHVIPQRRQSMLHFLNLALAWLVKERQEGFGCSPLPGGRMTFSERSAVFTPAESEGYTN